MMNLLKKNLKVFFLSGSFILLSFSVAGQQRGNKPTNTHSSAHKNLLASQGDLKKEIDRVDSLLMSYSFMLEEDSEEPASDIYGGEWNTERVNPYNAQLPDSLLINCSSFCSPVRNTYITSEFGWRSRYRRMHYGTDLKLQVGDSVYAAFSGKVRVCNFERRGYGNYVVLRHYNGFETVYGHLSAFLVAEGDEVKVGQLIALGGNTGRSTGPHLHFEVRVKGQPINPTDVFDFKNEVAHRDVYVFNGRKVTADRVMAEKYTKERIKYYTVKNGDTLSSIARKYGLSLAQLCKMNNISAKKGVRSGQRLRCS